MTKKMYLISKELDEAIQRIFDDPVQGYQALGAKPPDGLATLGLSQKKSVSIAISPLVRISLLRRLLEDWVELKAAEIQEFEVGPEHVRIQNEALATLMVLREIQTYFSDSETASKEELEKVEHQL